MKLKYVLAMMAFALVACSEDAETVRVTERYALDMLDMGVSLTEEICDSERTGQLLSATPRASTTARERCGRS